jgi:hypothetical protein
MQTSDKWQRSLCSRYKDCVGPTVERPRDLALQSGASHSSSELISGGPSDTRALASISACSHCLRVRLFP